ncbi:MAG: 2-amino-4-hydroxy-6-hydroxymethyldihydropteridine diphosphokinase [Anaerolineales bacterium]|nr:2-amino-4-hydroxy-6-hydroxymethyldihydropteridine diphosphokinase [Anaerolineales bacterium]
MNNLHRAYLNLGSNIEPQLNLPRGIRELRSYGEITARSSVWESPSVGFDGPNFLNVCVLFLTDLQPAELKEKIIRPIESKLGRVRNAEKNAPRTLDIDLVLFDDEPIQIKYWDYAFVAAPLAELLPEFIHPIAKQKLSEFVKQTEGRRIIQRRSDLSL